MQITALESEVADLDKELTLRSEMETALKETLRDFERKVARQETGGRSVSAAAAITASTDYMHRHVCNVFLVCCIYSQSCVLCPLAMTSVHPFLLVLLPLPVAATGYSYCCCCCNDTSELAEYVTSSVRH